MVNFDTKGKQSITEHCSVNDSRSQNVSNVSKSTQITKGTSMGNIRVPFRVPYLKMEWDGAILECRFTVCDWLIEPNIPKSQTINILVVSKRLLHVLSRKQLAFSHPSALTKSKCKNCSILSSKFDSLILKTHFISLGRVSNMHFLWLSKWGAGLMQNFHPEGSSSKRRNPGF